MILWKYCWDAWECLHASSSCVSVFRMGLSYSHWEDCTIFHIWNNQEWIINVSVQEVSFIALCQQLALAVDSLHTHIRVSIFILKQLTFNKYWSLWGRAGGRSGSPNSRWWSELLSGHNNFNIIWWNLCWKKACSQSRFLGCAKIFSHSLFTTCFNALLLFSVTGKDRIFLNAFHI